MTQDRSQTQRQDGEHVIEIFADGSVVPDQTTARRGEVVRFHSEVGATVEFEDERLFGRKKLNVGRGRGAKLKIPADAEDQTQHLKVFVGTVTQRPGDPCIIVEGGPD